MQIGRNSDSHLSPSFVNQAFQLDCDLERLRYIYGRAPQRIPPAVEMEFVAGLDDDAQHLASRIAELIFDTVQGHLLTTTISLACEMFLTHLVKFAETG